MPTNNITTCNMCGAITEESELHQTDHGRYHVCHDCLERIPTCVFCGEHIRNIYHYRNTDGDYGFICSDCAEEEDLIFCDECETFVHSDCYDDDCCIWCAESGHDNPFFDDDCDDDYDDDDDDKLIRRYHYHKGYERFYGTDSNLFIGIELEVDGGDDPEECATEIKRVAGDRLYFEHDGSLSWNGIEIISHPHTLSEFKNIPWADVLKTCESYGYKSHDAGNCGLHIHMSRAFFGQNNHEQRGNLSKLVWFYDKYYDELFKASRRTWNQVNHYAHRCGYSAREVYSCLRHNHGHLYDRYCAVNLDNSDTVEIRLGRGTLRYESFKAWIDLTVTIARNIVRLTWTELQNPEKALEGIMPETAEYLRSRHSFEGVL